MKNFIFGIFLCLFLSLIISCKNDPKPDQTETVEVAVDSIDVVEAVVEEEEVVEKKKPVAKKEKETSKKKKTTTTKKPEKKQITGPGIPSFDSSLARTYVRNYETYIVNYKKAVNANDMDSFLKLSEASSDLTKQYNQLVSKLSSEDMQKLSKYMQAKTVQLNKISESM